MGQLLYRGPSGHFDIFRESARLIWAGQSPYGIAYPAGYFLYSPACAYFFYGLFAFFPYSLGLFLNMISSTLVFSWGAWRLLRVLGEKSIHNIFFFLLSSEMIGSILNARIEVFIAGALLLALSFIVERRRLALAYFILALICNFKMLSFPTVGLLLLIQFFRRDWRCMGIFFLSLCACYAAPSLVGGWAFLKVNHQILTKTLGPYMMGNWMEFQHIYHLLRSLSGYTLSFGQAQVFALSAAIALAGFFIWMRKKVIFSELELWAAGLGSAFALLFSPMSQSAGYILYAPLLLACLRQAHFAERRSPWIAVAGGYFFISTAYSDLMPRVWREELFNFAIKPLGILILTFSLIFYAVKTRPRHSLCNFNKS